MCEGDRVEIVVARDRRSHYAGHDRLPPAPVNIDSDLDVGLFWVVVDSSSLRKLGTMIFGFEGGKSSIADTRKPLSFLLQNRYFSCSNNNLCILFCFGICNVKVCEN